MTALALAKYYFDLSNKSDFEQITKLFDERSTFCNAKSEFFIGSDAIMEMQRKHHGMYKNLHWHVDLVEEVKPNVIRFEFTFKGESGNGESVEYQGIETVVIYEKLIQHIHVQLV